MRFPYFMWVIAIPEGGHCPFLMRPTRRECIEAFEAWHPDRKWTQAQRKGWRCIKMAVRPANPEMRDRPDSATLQAHLTTKPE